MSRATGPGPRSLELLTWLCRVGASPTAPLAAAHGLPERTTRDHLLRLRRAGLVDRWPTLNGDALYAATKHGHRQLERPWRGSRQRPHEFEHIVAIAQTAAWLSTTPTCSWWRAERELHVSVPPDGQDPDQWSSSYVIADRDGQGAIHTRTPDLVASLADTVTAIEVERTQKEGRRLRAILTGWGRALQKQHVGRVIYVVPDERMSRVIERARTDAAKTVAALGTDALLIRTLDQLEPLSVPTGHAGTGGHPEAEESPAALVV
ncbi:MAG TPA: helix-turn-helix transcriptional regulator [Baekduia sp.]|nr:helix-turn-helix transcriptional regulator [Baekduia sp.]